MVGSLGYHRPCVMDESRARRRFRDLIGVQSPFAARSATAPQFLGGLHRRVNLTLLS
jgi:hypothetical protein